MGNRLPVPLSKPAGHLWMILIYSMQERLCELKSELQGLTDIIGKRDFTRYEYRASERTLQVLIEACIGIAKHWCYALNKAAPADGYSAFTESNRKTMNTSPLLKIKQLLAE